MATPLATATLVLAVVLIEAGSGTAADPLALHAENPRYFRFRGQPEFLITSGEHYGALMNRDFKDCLNDFVSAASERGIVVEFVLFCPFYDDNLWEVSPMNARNNVNHVGIMPRTEVYTLKHPSMMAIHQALVRKLVTELHRFDNLYQEICNEPYFGGVTLDWQARIAAVIVETETKFGGPKHLIAQNIANGRSKIQNPDPAVSLFNFHYATPPDVIALKIVRSS
jgi:hypothetical protein